MGVPRTTAAGVLSGKSRGLRTSPRLVPHSPAEVG